MAPQKRSTLNKRKPGRNRRKVTPPSSGNTKAYRTQNKRTHASRVERPKQNFERYTALAQAAAKSGDIIQSEYYYQHAEHYLRLIKEKAA